MVTGLITVQTDDGLVLVNCTARTLSLQRKDGSWFQVPASGVSVHIDTEETELPISADGVPCYRSRQTRLPTIPEPVPGTWYLVPRLVALQYPERNDLWVPDQIQKDRQGMPMGAKRLVRLEGW